VGVARAVAALQRAAEQGADALAQVPLEAILNNSVDGLQASAQPCTTQDLTAVLDAEWGIGNGNVRVAIVRQGLSCVGVEHVCVNCL
jgi:hypothetical protein